MSHTQTPDQLQSEASLMRKLQALQDELVTWNGVSYPCSKEVRSMFDKLLAQHASRVDELQGEGTKLIEERRDLQAKIDAIYKALDAAELSAWKREAIVAGSDIRISACNCSSCIVIRGIKAFIEKR